MAHMREAVPPMVRDDGVAVPPALEQVVLKALEKDAEARFADMNEFVAALKAASGQMGAPLHTSGNYALSGAFDLSGMRATPGVTPNGTPSSGFPASSPSGGFSTASGSVPAPDFEQEKGGAGKWIMLLLVLALGGGAAAAFMGGAGQQGEATQAATEPTAPAANANANSAEEPPTEENVNEPPPEPELRVVSLNITSAPTGANVMLDGELIGQTPLQRDLAGDDAARGRTLNLEFSLRGYQSVPVQRILSGAQAMDIAVALQRNAPVRPVRRRTTRSTSPTPRPTGGSNPNFRDSPY